MPCTLPLLQGGPGADGSGGGVPHSLVVDRAGVIKFSGHLADPAFMSAVREVLHGPLQA